MIHKRFKRHSQGEKMQVMKDKIIWVQMYSPISSACMPPGKTTKSSLTNVMLTFKW